MAQVLILILYLICAGKFNNYLHVWNKKAGRNKMKKVKKPIKKKDAMVFIRANKGLLCLFKVSYNSIESWEK